MEQSKIITGKKFKTFSVCLYGVKKTQTCGSLGEREMLWEPECFHSTFELSQTFTSTFIAA